MNSQTVISPKRTKSFASTKAPQNPQPTAPAVQERPEAASSEGRQEVFFKLNAGTAKEVLLAGDFTGWEKTPIRLRKDAEGGWQTKVMLAPGQYHYKFLVDGKWQDDPSAGAKCSNPFGTCNSVLKVQ